MGNALPTIGLSVRLSVGLSVQSVQFSQFSQSVQSVIQSVLSVLSVSQFSQSGQSIQSIGLSHFLSVSLSPSFPLSLSLCLPPSPPQLRLGSVSHDSDRLSTDGSRPQDQRLRLGHRLSALNRFPPAGQTLWPAFRVESSDRIRHSQTHHGAGVKGELDEALLAVPLPDILQALEEARPLPNVPF